MGTLTGIMEKWVNFGISTPIVLVVPLKSLVTLGGHTDPFELQFSLRNELDTYTWLYVLIYTRKILSSVGSVKCMGVCEGT